MRPAEFTRTYRVVMILVWPIVRLWGRLEIVGADVLPASGPTLLLVNHDTAWDPLVVGVAAMRRRQIGALARSSLWQSRLLGWVLDQMGQIPIERGRGDSGAIDAAVSRLNAGGCIGIFPEGTVSRGRVLPARSGAGRLVAAAPGTQVVCVRVTGAVDIVRFPKRPRIRVEFFEPAGGPPRPEETASAVTARMLAEIRHLAPPANSGRRNKATQFDRDRDAQTEPGPS